MSLTPYKDMVIAHASLVGLWPLSETSGNAVDVKNGNNGIGEGTLTQNQASLLPNGEGASCQFTAGGFKVAPAAAINLGEPVAFEAWIKPTSVSSFRQVFDLNVNSGGMSLNAGRPEMGKSGVASLFRANTALTANTVHHIVVQKSGTTRQVFIDGVSVATTELNGASLSANELDKFIAEVHGGLSLWEGYLQYVAVYGSLLTATEIKEHYEAGSTKVSAEEKAPEVTTEAASEIAAEAAKLNGQVDANNASTTYYFRYLRSEAEFIKPAGGAGLPLCSDGTWIYFHNNSGYVGRVKLDGTELNNEWVKTSTSVTGAMACNTTHIFFVDANTGHMARLKNDGTELNKEFIKELGPEPGGVGLNATHLFWGLENNIGRATIAGAEKNTEFVKATGRGLDVQVTATNIYWLSPFSWIGRATLAGGSVEKEWVKSIESNGGLVVDTDAIYWANSAQDAIGRCNIDGTTVEKTWLPGACDNCRKLTMGGETLFAGGVGATVAISRHKFLFQPSAKNGSAGSGENPAAVSQNVESLAGSTRYNFQLIATNAKGTARGTWLNFTTSAAGKLVKVKVGSELKSVKRWVMVNGSLVSK